MVSGDDPWTAVNRGSEVRVMKLAGPRLVLARLRVGAVAAVLVAAVAIPASRIVTGRAVSSGDNLICNAAGTLTLTPSIGGRWVWEFSGGGSCIGDAKSPQIVSFAGSGSSQGLGACGPSGTVSDLSMTMAVSFLDPTVNETTVLLETWGAGTTTFPIATPFDITKSGATLGAGNLDTHLYAHCPPGGTSAAFVAWAQEIP